MKKIRMLELILLTATFITILSGCSSNQNKYNEKEVNVYYINENNNQKTKLRFYDKTKDIPYIGIKNYYSILLKDTPLSTRSNLNISHAGNEYTVETPKGGVATINVDKDTFKTNNFILFNSTNYFNTSSDTGLLQLDGMPWIRVKNITYNKEASPFYVDFSKYKIDLFGDENDVYFPFNTVCDLFLNENLLNCSYNQKDIYVINGTYSEETNQFNNYVNPIFETELSDLYLEYNYMEYCFTYDKLLGRPGRSSVERNLNLNNGLDYALSNNELGKEIKKLLLSSNKDDYFLGTILMNDIFGDGGHSNFIQISDYISLLSPTEQQKYMLSAYKNILEKRSQFISEGYKILIDSELTIKEQLLVRTARERMFGYNLDENNKMKTIVGTKSYFKKGDTAIICVDDFMGEVNNRYLWEDYYEGRIDNIPFDEKTGGAVGALYNGLIQAKKDNVENVIIDLSSNMGGSVDELMYLVAILTNKKQIKQYNNITGQLMTAEFEIDINLDRVFDEKDNYDMVGDLNLAVITSPNGFSCGGISPIYLHEANIFTMGDNSGGGSCSIYYLYDIYGLKHIASSPHQIFTLNGASIDAIRNHSCDKYIPIQVIDGVKYYDDYFAIDKLKEYIQEHYKSQE